MRLKAVILAHFVVLCGRRSTTTPPFASWNRTQTGSFEGEEFQGRKAWQRRQQRDDALSGP